MAVKGRGASEEALACDRGIAAALEAATAGSDVDAFEAEDEPIG